MWLDVLAVKTFPLTLTVNLLLFSFEISLLDVHIIIYYIFSEWCLWSLSPPPPLFILTTTMLDKLG